MAEWVLIKEGRLIAADVIRWKEGIYAARRSRKRKATRRSGTWKKRDVLGEFWHVLASEGGPKTTTYVLQLRLLIRTSQDRALDRRRFLSRTPLPDNSIQAS